MWSFILLIFLTFNINVNALTYSEPSDWVTDYTGDIVVDNGLNCITCTSIIKVTHTQAIPSNAYVSCFANTDFGAASGTMTPHSVPSVKVPEDSLTAAIRDAKGANTEYFVLNPCWVDQHSAVEMRFHDGSNTHTLQMESGGETSFQKPASPATHRSAGVFSDPGTVMDMQPVAASEITGTVTFSSAINWGYIPISADTSIDTLFNGIDTTDLTVIGEASYVGKTSGDGFFGAATLLQPNKGFVLINRKASITDITIQYLLPASAATGDVTFSSAINWGYIPISADASIDTLFNGIDTSDLTVIGEASYVGKTSGDGFFGAATLLQPNKGFVLINRKASITDITLGYNYLS